MKKYKFNEFIILHDKKRIPLSSIERKKRQGNYRYYGAQGVIDHINDYIFDGKFVLLAEDGENLKSKKQNIAQYVTGKFWVNNHAHIITTTDICRLKYFYYLINTIDVSEYITGSAQPKLSQISMNKMEFEIPEIKVQDKILSILNAIDKKITLNNEINKNLQLQAQTLFIAWFETFEPFVGVVPDSWKQITLGDIAEIKTNSFNPQKNPDVLIEHYSIPAFDENKYPVFEYSSGVKSNKYILSNNSVMISKLNPDTKRVWRPLCLSDFAVSSTEFIIFEPYNPKYKDYVYSIIDSQGFTDRMCSHTTGSTNSRQRTTPATTLNYNLWMPDDESIKKFLNAVTPMYDLISQNLCQNQELVSLRDSLLPKLMSGELDVSNIDI